MYIRKLLTKLFAPLAFSRGGGGEAPPFAFRRRVGGEAVILICLSLTSCGLLDYDMEEGREEVAVAMNLERDTMYVMTGDRFKLTPLFEPDTVNIGDLYFYTDRPNILFFSTEGFEALEPGWAKVYAMSVSSRISDSCAVCVLEPWDYVIANYPHETVIYAEITVNGVEATEDDEFAAFVGSELRAFGDYNIAYDKEFFIFRVSHELLGPDTPRERINLYKYDSVGHNLYTGSQWFYADGESHGTPSNPVKIDFR